MSKQNTVTCPNCRHEFNIETALSADIEKEINEKLKVKFNQDAAKWKQDQIKEIEQQKELLQQSYKKRLEDEQERLRKERMEEEEKLKKQREELEESLRKRLSAENEALIQSLRKQNEDNEEKVKTFRQQEINMLEREKTLKDKQDQMELELKRKESELQKQIEENVQKKEAEKTELMRREYDKKLEDQRRLIEEMNRKIEQGSMQLQGEVQELALEEFLRHNFPFDEISEVGKGVRGADCVQTVRNQFGQNCGKIIYESKRTKDFSNDWIEKLKADMRNQQADIAILVTQAMPKDMDKFGEKDGVWICNYTEVKALAYVLRQGILKIFTAVASQENKGDKMVMLYNYLTGNEFGEQWKAIREGFQSMKLSIQKERDAMERMWKVREKQLEKVLLNATHIQGSIEGIAGTSGSSNDLMLDFGIDLLPEE